MFGEKAIGRNFRHDPWPAEATGYKAKETATWRIHAPQLEALDVDAVVAYAKNNVPADLYEQALLAQRILSDVTLWQSAATNTPVPPSRVHKRVGDAMEQNGILAPLTGTPKAWGLLTTKPEPLKEPPRLRVISDMLWSNWALDDMVKTSFSSQAQLDAKLRARYGATFDFTGWYYALPVREAVGEYLAVRIGDTIYRHARAPMGHKWMVFAAHTLTQVIAWTPHLNHDVIIDNVMYSAEDELLLRRECDAFMSRAALFKATIGEATGPSRSITYRGMVASMAETVTVKRSWAEKCARRISYVLTRGATAAQIYSIGGMLAWLRGVVPIEGLEDYHLWKDIARAANSTPDKRMTLHAASLQALKTIQTILEAEDLPTRKLSEPPRPRALLITDASLARPLGRWGAIVVTTRIRALAGLFPIPLCRVASIADLEMAAVLLAVTLVPLYNLEIVLIIDNQSAWRVLEKRRSCAWRLHMFGKEIHARVRSLGSSLQARWVPSARNPADGISRGKAMSDADLAQALSLAHEFGVVPEGIGLNKEIERIEVDVCQGILLHSLSIHKGNKNALSSIPNLGTMLV